MSHCANYVLVLDGQRRIANSRWGSKSLLTSLAFGPESALEFLLEATSDIDDEQRFVYGELMCEGAVFADFDERRLLVFGGEDLRSEKPLQRAYVALQRLAWPGWDVQWAYGGWQDVARVGGLEVRAEDPDRPRRLGGLEPFVPYQKYWGPAPDGDYAWFDEADAWHRPIDAQSLYFNRGEPFTCVTLRTTSGDVRHYQIADLCTRMFATGPALLPLLATMPEASFAPASNGAEGGLLIDEGQRRVRYWVGRDAKSWHADLVGAAWSDWEVARDDRALPGQLDLIGQDSSAVEIPLRLLGEAVVRILLREVGDNSGITALVEEIRQRASQPNVVVAPGATRLPAGHEPVTPGRAEFLASLVLQLQ